MSPQRRLELLQEFDTAPLDALLTQEHVAAFLGCSSSLMERNRWSGQGIPFLKIGRLARYRKRDALNFIEGGRSFRSTTEAQQYEAENDAA